LIPFKDHRIASGAAVVANSVKLAAGRQARGQRYYREHPRAAGAAEYREYIARTTGASEVTR
jgi:hypothetical protein